MRWETAVMEECAGIAEVIRVTKHPVVEIAEGVEVGGSTIHARIYAPAEKYSYGHFLVKILKPSEHVSLHEKGLQMENGEFGFDSGEELKVGEKLEILIFPAAPENLP
jgi:hypothetical protein